jgi:hypothetical protein
VSVINVKGRLTTAVASRSIVIVAAEHVYQGMPVLLRLLHQAPSVNRLLLPMIQSLPPPPDSVLGQEMSLFASTLDAQDGMSVSSTEVENQFNDFPEDDRNSAVPQDDDTNVHNSMATVGDAVPAYRFNSWLGSDEPDALVMEDHILLLGEVDLCKNEGGGWMMFHPNQVIVTPQSITSSPPFLFLGMQRIAKMQYQNTFATTKK